MRDIKNAKKKKSPGRELNPDLPIQRQTTCPLHHTNFVVEWRLKLITEQTIVSSLLMEGPTSVSFRFFSKGMSVWTIFPFFSSTHLAVAQNETAIMSLRFWLLITTDQGFQMRYFTFL